MKNATRRLFLKIAVATAAVGAGGKYVLNKYTEPRAGGIIGTPAEAAQGIPVVSDVDAHSQCRMRVKVEGGKVMEVRGDPTDPEGKGQLTLRGEHIKEFLYAPDRLTSPMKRVGERGEGKWERISRDEALTTIANRLNEVKQQYGAEAIDFHHGHHHSGDILGTYLPRLANLIGTPNITNPSHVCHLPRVFLQYNIDFGAVFQPDLPHTKCLLLWGGNPQATNKPQEIEIKEARAHSIKLIVIDPRVTSYAEEADIHAQLRPGTDGALALGMLHVIIKESLYEQNLCSIRYILSFVVVRFFRNL
jgi:anaerobic selenocysteine-containing dehydrogenase